MLPSGRQRVLHNQVYSATFYMSNAGLIASPQRSRFIANENGRARIKPSIIRTGRRQLRGSGWRALPPVDAPPR